MTEVAIVVRHKDGSITIHPRTWDDFEIVPLDACEDGATYTVFENGKALDVELVTEKVDTPKGEPKKHRLRDIKPKKQKTKR